MSQTTENTEVVSKEPIIGKINTLINEERLIKDITTVQLSRLKNFDDLANEISTSSIKDQAIQLLEENLSESSGSVVSRYLLGILASGPRGMQLLKSLLEDYHKSAKWMIVDHVADRILDLDEHNRHALRAKVESTERLRGKKELKPYLEKLAAIDRKNPETLHKFALSILEEEPDRALLTLKQAAEFYARNKDYRPLEEIWSLIVEKDYSDLAFFERIERILIGNREKTRMAAFLQSLVEPYRQLEDWPNIIMLLKKILEYEPTSTRARSELVRTYKARYADHSLLNEFLKMSELTNNKKNVGPCIDSFERNIVFDKGNYVAHRSRGVGKIKEIDSDHIVIDFPGNQDQKMTIQMAISSLQPLGKEHIWVRFYENPDEVKGLFENDVPEFFRLLLSSFNKRMSLGEIKSEIVGRFVTAEEWSKWWNRTRTLLKKSESFTFNPKKKDELILLEREITQSDELISRFKGNSEWNKKLDIAMEALKNTDTESVENAIHDFIKHYREQEENRDLLKKIQSFLFVELASLALGEDEIQHKTTFEDIREIFRAARPNALIKFCGDTENVDIKREIVNLIIKSREDFPAILGDILFEVPIKVNRYVLGELNRLGKSDVLKNFIQLSFKRYREFPEILLWIAKSVLSGQWHYDWLSVNRQEIMLLLFRLLKPLVQIEKKGTRLKNSALENIFGTTNITVDSIKKGMLFEILKEADLSVIRRMAALFRDVPYVPDAHKENFLSLIQSIHPAFSMESEDREEVEEEAAESLFPEEGVILVSEQGLVKRREYLNHLINVDLPANSRDIGEAQEKGDLRENAEYKAAMERQQQLQAEILKLDNELKKARTIDPKGIRTDIVTIGSKVSVSTPDGSEIAYTILGPWDADTERNIISYLSPLGMGLIGKRVDEEAVLDGEKRFRIRGISLGL